ncbi:antibiotic biosynthesis monooxygenase [Algoriphagus boseongensis]|uniref:Antibiotic biosynthesis monooxygenase n=1 Tax=Algoriphagus boseongensis TaxID=1442587 RepID=A0A4R6T853_9BACT|nr:antibiotic biosynthesis monooxygenase [Algoriphagus boseongensis]TDQ18881.1 antibiotic biosynthesis monooxygenase [Algoriphagus boseongensis]
MKKIHLTARFHIHPGKEAEFKGLIPTCVAKVKAEEPGVERYQWFLNPEGTICHVLETYSDSEAVLNHMINMGELLGRLMGMSTLEGELYWDLSDQLKDAASGLPLKTFSFLEGF